MFRGFTAFGDQFLRQAGILRQEFGDQSLSAADCEVDRLQYNGAIDQPREQTAAILATKLPAQGGRDDDPAVRGDVKAELDLWHILHL
jgi:hypothetical protein